MASWTRGGTWWTRQWSWRVAVHVAGPAIRTGEMFFYGKFFLTLNGYNFCQKCSFEAHNRSKDSSFNFEHFDILWASNGHSYQKLYLFEVKKKVHKKTFRRYEWRDPSRGQCLAISTGKSTRCCHVSNSPTPLASFLQKQPPSEKSFETAPFENKFLKGASTGQFATLCFIYLM